MTTYGLTTYGTLAYGEIESQYDLSTPNPFDAYLKNINAQLVYLVEVYPYDPSQLQTLYSPQPYGSGAYGEADSSYYGGVTTVYLSDQGFITEPSDTPSSQYFLAQVDNPVQIQTSILSGDTLGAGNQSFGAIVIANGNGKLDYLQDYRWSNRRVVIKAGVNGFTYSQFSTVFEGSANGIEVDDERVTITMQDYRAKVDQLLVPGVYAGTGGLEGGADIANKPKPLCYGVVNNIEPALVDAVNLIYQIHDGSIQAVDEIRDNGVAIANAGNTSNIQTASVPAGFFMTDLSKGYFKLGATPAGRITCDAQGENGNGGYVSTIGAIIGRIVKTRLGAGSLSSNDIDAGALNRLDAVVSGPSGIYLPDRVSASKVIDDMIPPVGAYWTFSRQGQLTAGVLQSPSSPVFTINSDLIDDQGISIQNTIAPAWRISVGYAPAFLVQAANELAAGTSATDRAFVTQQYRYVSFQDDVIRGQNAQSVERTFLTNLTNKTDAESLLSRLSSLYSTVRVVYRLTIYKSLFRLYVGDMVNLVYDRYGLSGGKTLMIASLAEDAETGQTTLELWG
jgi:hypothetical protein